MNKLMDLIATIAEAMLLWLLIYLVIMLAR